MASPGSAAAPAERVPDHTDPAPPAVDADKRLNLGQNTNVEVDPALPSEVIDDEKKRHERDNVHTFKSAILISGIAVAVIGAIFAITKKLRER